MEAKVINRAKETVIAAINALNDEDYKRARKYFSDDMKFVGVLGSRNGAEDYFTDMEKMKLHYDIQKVIADEDDVCIFYNMNLSGGKIFSCGWYHVINGKIDSLKVIFDPRPVLEAKKN